MVATQSPPAAGTIEERRQGYPNFQPFTDVTGQCGLYQLHEMNSNAHPRRRLRAQQKQTIFNRLRPYSPCTPSRMQQLQPSYCRRQRFDTSLALNLGRVACSTRLPGSTVRTGNIKSVTSSMRLGHWEHHCRYYFRYRTPCKRAPYSRHSSSISGYR